MMRNSRKTSSLRISWIRSSRFKLLCSPTYLVRITKLPNPNSAHPPPLSLSQRKIQEHNKHNQASQTSSSTWWAATPKLTRLPCLPRSHPWWWCSPPALEAPTAVCSPSYWAAASRCSTSRWRLRQHHPLLHQKTTTLSQQPSPTRLHSLLAWLPSLSKTSKHTTFTRGCSTHRCLPNSLHKYLITTASEIILRMKTMSAAYANPLQWSSNKRKAARQESYSLPLSDLSDSCLQARGHKFTARVDLFNE